ncbi:MAG: ornithine cyclodeaminase family protein, partial [Chloroflexota bacterium]|nr:ornithine cyclodeaminase family protein [Chloroflexota bacterium]
KVYDKRPEASQKYAEAMEARLKLKVRAVATIEAAADADIVVAVTPATTPIIQKQHIRPGTHINAIGADAKGKEELEPEILKTAKIIVDNIEQAAHSGEINVPILQGVITVDDIYATLGEVVTHRKKGRENNDEITVFDSTGLAILDIGCARLVYNKAREKGLPGFRLQSCA